MAEKREGGTFQAREQRKALTHRRLGFVVVPGKRLRGK